MAYGTAVYVPVHAVCKLSGVYEPRVIVYRYIYIKIPAPVRIGARCDDEALPYQLLQALRDAIADPKRRIRLLDTLDSILQEEEQE